MWSKLKVRVLSALIGAIIVIAITVWAPARAFHGVMSLVSFVMLYELLQAFGLTKKWQLLFLNYGYAVGLLLLPLCSNGIGQNLIVFLLVTYVMLLFVCSVLWHESIHLNDVFSALFALIYAVLFPIHLSYIRMHEHGVALLFLAFVGAWMPDIFAYFSGKLLGKKKLIPAISPNKTIAGSVGAIVGCVLMFLVYALIVSLGFGYRVYYLPLIILALLCGVFAQFGDLTASVVKRACGVKDFGNLIPGHGGMTDRVDSLIFVAPLLYYFIQVFEVIYK
ncbi:MAG: phosphatidate cytidylyltransferase [Ruminococcaceae bacterium]|nr:phosphatidate cytidylyltransferase [Oscillospiraceae bacterium]